MWALLKKAAFPLLIVFVLLQVFPPARTNPGIDPNREIHASLPAHAPVAAVLSRACNDCHSNRTIWPWYSRMAPVSWLIVSDVNRGRAKLNFSEWSAYPDKNRKELLADICKEVSEGEMPGLPYRLLHPRAKLNESERSQVCTWTRTVSGDSSAVSGE